MDWDQVKVLSVGSSYVTHSDRLIPTCPRLTPFDVFKDFGGDWMVTQGSDKYDGGNDDANEPPSNVDDDGMAMDHNAMPLDVGDPFGDADSRSIFTSIEEGTHSDYSQTHSTF